MRITSQIMLSGLLALGLSACGKERHADPRTWGKKADQPSAVVGEEGDQPAPKMPTNPTEGPTAEQHAPLETFLLDGLVLPPRLMAETLTVQFQANVVGATFECALGSTTHFAPCDGDRYAFGTLVHARSYSLRVRAVLPDGRLDRTPLVVSFVADLLTGTPPSVTPANSGVAARLPDGAAGLPQALAAGSLATTQERTLQVGAFYAVTAPADFQVTAFATDKNLSATQQYFRLIREAGVASGIDLSRERACTGEFEAEVQGPAGSGTVYCEATPPAGEWEDAYTSPAAPVAKNHLEMVRLSPEGIEEKLLVAAFDKDRDGAERSLGIDSLCNGSNYQGETFLPLVSTFYGDMNREVLHWCQAADRDGQWWWIGRVDTEVSWGRNPARLKIFYAVSVRQGLFSGPQFATYAERRLPRLIIPIAEPSGIR